MFQVLKGTQTVVSNMSELNQLIMESNGGPIIHNGHVMAAYKRVDGGRDMFIEVNRIHTVDGLLKKFEVEIPESYRQYWDGAKIRTEHELIVWCRKCGEYMGFYSDGWTVPFCPCCRHEIDHSRFISEFVDLYCDNAKVHWEAEQFEPSDDDYFDGMYNAHEQMMERLDEKWHEEGMLAYIKWIMEENNFTSEDVAKFVNGPDASVVIYPEGESMDQDEYETEISEMTD